MKSSHIHMIAEKWTLLFCWTDSC